MATNTDITFNHTKLASHNRASSSERLLHGITSGIGYLFSHPQGNAKKSFSHTIYRYELCSGDSYECAKLSDPHVYDSTLGQSSNAARD